MSDAGRIEKADGGPPPLFVLSFRHRDELTGLAEAAGWQPIAARRVPNAESRFIASGASVAIVDARGALSDGLEAVRALADAAEANAAALLVLVSRNDGAAVDQFHSEGATHFLVSPFSERQLVQAVHFAERHAERVGGGQRERRAEPSGSERGASWRWRPGSTDVELSPVLARKMGLGGEEKRLITLMEFFRKLDPDGRRAARGAIDRVVATGQATAFAHADGKGARLAHHIRMDEDAGGVLGLTERIPPDDAPRLPARDPMTGLKDGRALRTWIEDRIEASQGVVLLLLAVSRFDAINAAFGRAAGDTVLQAAARRIERVVSPNGSTRLVARVAGAQFAIALAPPATLTEASFLAGEVVEALARPFMAGDHVITLGSRAGVVASEAGDDSGALLRRASAALVEAKAADSGPVRVMERGAQHESALGDRLEIDLRRALDQDEIEILFQPQVSVTSGRIVGAEALARWRHPDFGELGAVTLFSVAERSDYVVQLSDHVQRKAITAAASWPQALGDLRLSVNITAADIVRPGFAAQFKDLVDASDFDRSRLTVEVTESGLIEDLNTAAHLLASLREGGLRVAIDDFGTGYSSLAYLKALPLDYLKIDKRLCEDITGSPRDRVVVRSVIDMARSLGLDVIAEGVETQEQLDLLAEEGCTLFQGFLCSRPVDTEALVALLDRQRLG